MKSNTRRIATPAPRTHEGAVAPRIPPYQQLRRSVLSCMLGEREFYESGVLITQRIADLIPKCTPHQVASLAIEAREVMHLRHIPLFLVRELARKGGPVVSSTLARVIQRADELPEFLSLYWGAKRTPISKQVRKGLAAAFSKFSSYQLAKYKSEGKGVSLRDVMFLVHPKPLDDVQAEVWKQLAANELKRHGTWEDRLSAGEDPRTVFTDLIAKGELGYFALLRNLRGMLAAGVDVNLIKMAIVARGHGADKILPFRFVAAARAAPAFEGELDIAMAASIQALPQLKGGTLVLVDVSGSMNVALSTKSDLTRMDAAAALASVINAENLRVFTFSNHLIEVPGNRRGMAGVDAVRKSQPHQGTALQQALRRIDTIPYDRLIVISDEQADTPVTYKPKAGSKAYMINVASAKNGVGYGPHWQHLDGFSEGVLHWIHAFEAELEREKEMW